MGWRKAQIDIWALPCCDFEGIPPALSSESPGEGSRGRGWCFWPEEVLWEGRRGAASPGWAGLAAYQAQQGSVTWWSGSPASVSMSYLGSQPLHPDVSVQQRELFPFSAGASMCSLLTASSGRVSPQILWGFCGMFLSSLIATPCSCCLWKRLQAVFCCAQPDLSSGH